MADFQSEIPEEYLDSEFDFGFTAVDEGELRSITTGEESESTGGSVSSEHLDDVQRSAPKQHALQMAQKPHHP